MALIDLGNIVIISNDLTVVVNFPTWNNDCDSHSPALFDVFLFSDAGICYTVALLSLGNHDHVLVSVSIDFPSNSKRDAPFLTQLIIIFVLVGAIFIIIWEMFHGRISLNLVLLLLVLNLSVGPDLK